MSYNCQIFVCLCLCKKNIWRINVMSNSTLLYFCPLEQASPAHREASKQDLDFLMRSIHKNLIYAV